MIDVAKAGHGEGLRGRARAWQGKSRPIKAKAERRSV